MTKRHEIDQVAKPGCAFDKGGTRLQTAPGYLQRLGEQLEDSDWSERLRAVGELMASGDVKAYPYLLNVLLRDDPVLHRAVI